MRRRLAARVGRLVPVPVRAIGLFLAAVLMIASCGSETPRPEAEFDTDADSTFTFAGFEIEVLDVGVRTPEDASEVGSGPTVTVLIDMKNHGRHPADIAAESLALTDGTETFTPDLLEVLLPTVDPGESQEATVEYPVKNDFDFSGAVLVAGRAGVWQATVPLGTDGEYQPLSPRGVGGGSAPVGLLEVDVTGGQVRGDDPASYRQLAEFDTFVSFDLALDGRGGISPGSVVPASSFVLRRPDGVELAPLEGASSDGTIGPSGTGTMEVAFEVADYRPARYTLILRGPFGAGGAPVGEGMEVVLPRFPASSAD